MTHCYFAYGLVVQSEVPLAELDACAPRPCDVSIRREPIPSRQSQPTDALFLEVSEAEAYFEYAYIGRLLIRGVSEILVDAKPGLEEGIINMALLGPVMAVLLHRRGFFVLHGSAMRIGETGDIFLGDKGAGKSTLAGALLAAGHPLIADDLAAISFASGAPSLAPGFPQIKLSFEATGAFAIPDTDIIPTPIDDFPKNRLRLLQPFDHAERRVGACYVLERGEDARIEELNNLEALGAVLRYSYSVRFGKALLSGEVAAEHLRMCTRLINQVPVRRLVVPDGVGRLPALSALLEGRAR